MSKSDRQTVEPAFEHRASFPLPAPPERAFRALVDAAELARWFATDVQVEPRAGGAYRFFGAATLGTPRAADATQTLTSLEPGRALAFEWSILGVPTRVAYGVSPGDTADTSKLDVTHAVHGALPFRDPKHVIDDHWRLAVGNLMSHLKGDGDVVLPDYGSEKPEVRLSIEIGAPPAKVFRALLDPELMNRWLWGAKAKVDLATRAYSYGWEYEVEGRNVLGGPTRILELVENQRLVTDWTDWRGDPGKPMTRVTWILDPVAAGTRTRLTLLHDGFELPVDRSDYQQGWGEFARALRELVESA